MKLCPRLPCVLPALAAATALAAADPQRVDSRISAVTVYADRAIVTREAHVALGAGTQDVVFPGLPESLDPDLLQVSGDGTARATILDVRATPAQLAVAANPRLQELQEQLRNLQQDLRSTADRATVLQQQRDYLEKIKLATTTPPGKDGGPLPGIEQWQQLVAFYAESQGKLAGELQALDRQREELQQRIAAVQRQIDDLRAPGNRTVVDVSVRLDVTEAGEMDVKLDYTVAAASWTPTYDVRVNSADRSINLGYAALVVQSSGEDWSGVQLTLSTARPAVGGSAPELATWFLDEAHPEPMRLRGQMEPAASASGRGGEAADAVELSPFTVAAATVTTGLTAATFAISHPADVPADHATHKVAITSHPLEAELTYLTVPKLAELAYLRAAVTNTSDYPLIGGDVNLFLDGTFVARSRIQTVMPGEKFDLDLGVDDAIAVERKLINRLTEKTFLTRKQELTYDWLITVQNNRPQPIRLRVQDQVPVARNERIEVELLAPSAREIERDASGMITWTLDLAAGEKRELPLRLSVKYPPDMNVEGLE